MWAKHNKVVQSEYFYQDLCFYYKGKLLLWAKNNKVLTLNRRALHFFWQKTAINDPPLWVEPPETSFLTPPVCVLMVSGPQLAIPGL